LDWLVRPIGPEKRPYAGPNNIVELLVHKTGRKTEKTGVNRQKLDKQSQFFKIGQSTIFFPSENLNLVFLFKNFQRYFFFPKKKYNIFYFFSPPLL
jgi:hypothetical protein